MLNGIYNLIREKNRRRVERRRARARRRSNKFKTYYGPQNIVKLSAEAKVDVVAEYGSRERVRPDSICLPVFDAEPEVSIVIAAYGKVDYTLRCLQSIVRNPPSVPFEVIVVEDASGETDALLCNQVPGLRFVVNELNLGYIRTCNKGVSLSKGKYVYLLNNDTFVLEGAINALHQTCGRASDIMVGSKLIYPDGTLQDAGGIVWRNGTAWIFGRGDHASRHAFNYLREVDYCSGASLMLSRSLWEKVGGYDELYLPAYYEDTDLAFKVRQIGGRVLYQPEAVIIHDEGVSHGTSVNNGIKSYQIINQKKFADKWRKELLRDGFNFNEQMLKAKDRAKHKKTVLIIDHYIPEPDRDAGSRSMLSFIDVLLSIGCSVKFWPDNLNPTTLYAEALMAKGVELLAHPEVGKFKSWMKENAASVDVFLLSRPTVALNYIKAIRERSKSRIVFYGHDLHFARMKMQAEVTNNRKQAVDSKSMCQLEQSIWQACDVSLYPSQEEVDTVRAMAPSVDVRCANAYCLEVKPPRRVKPTKASLLFVAGFRHPPNEDAATWFVTHVLPLIKLQIPDVSLVLAGSNPTDRVKALACEGIEVTGSLSAEALLAQYDNAMVAVVPLRFGAGVKLKVLEAMVERVPLVTTSVGVQGLTATDFLPVADEPQAFAQHVLALLSDADQRERLVAAQADFITTYYSADALRATLSQAL